MAGVGEEAQACVSLQNIAVPAQHWAKSDHGTADVSPAVTFRHYRPQEMQRMRRFRAQSIHPPPALRLQRRPTILLHVR